MEGHHCHTHYYYCYYHCLPLLASLLLGIASSPARAGTGLYTGPYFPSSQPRNITVHQDTVAYLPCTVKQLGDKSVSWVRQRDQDILTVDSYTFVRDARLSVHYVSDTSTWTLVIKYVQERDAGTYECQVSTEPKMSMFVHLDVIVPQVEITGASDKYVRLGSTVRLQCTVSSTVQLPDYIFWYHNGERLLEYHQPRFKFNVWRRGGQGSEMSVTSTLLISDARASDAGNYTCLPSNLHSDTARLHVLRDEQPAAIHKGSARGTLPPSLWWLVLGGATLTLLYSSSLTLLYSSYSTTTATTTFTRHHSSSSPSLSVPYSFSSSLTSSPTNKTFIHSSITSASPVPS